MGPVVVSTDDVAWLLATLSADDRARLAYPGGFVDQQQQEERLLARQAMRSLDL